MSKAYLEGGRVKVNRTLVVQSEATKVRLDLILTARAEVPARNARAEHGPGCHEKCSNTVTSREKVEKPSVSAWRSSHYVDGFGYSYTYTLYYYTILYIHDIPGTWSAFKTEGLSNKLSF